MTAPSPVREEEVEVDGLGSVATTRTRGNCPRQRRWRRPGSTGRCATRPKPPQCRRCGAAAAASMPAAGLGLQLPQPLRAASLEEKRARPAWQAFMRKRNNGGHQSDPNNILECLHAPPWQNSRHAVRHIGKTTQPNPLRGRFRRFSKL